MFVLLQIYPPEASDEDDQCCASEKKHTMEALAPLLSS